MVKKGFTLIELLVVVLIIGILSAVALPQYQVTVAKARLSMMLPVLKTMIEAQESYYLANGKYATTFEGLDIDLPAGGTLNETAKKMIYPNGMVFDIWTSADGGSTSVRGLIDESQTYLVEYYMDGRHRCYAKKGNTVANRVCKSFSSQVSPLEESSTHNGYVID